MVQSAILLDLAAFAIFVAAWVGYSVVVERSRYAPGSAIARMGSYRNIWFACCLSRDARIVDMQITAAVQNGTALYASISLIALGGALATLRLPDDVLSTVSRFPFAVETTRAMWQAKSIGLSVIFVYAIFQFSAAYRIYNWVAILIGAMPHAQTKDTAEANDHVKRTARVYAAGTRRFYRGLRAVLFALGYLGWSFGPLALVVSLFAVVVMMWRLEFDSDVLRAIE
jgi:uncharacterized membrane protein